jgi:hypothetical protein
MVMTSLWLFSLLRAGDGVKGIIEYLFVFAFVFCELSSAQENSKEYSVNNLPSFDHFVVPEKNSTTFFSSNVVFVSHRAKRYRSIVSIEGVKAPNFAQKYRVVTWGCGADCHGFAIVNRTNGSVFTSRSIDYVAGVFGNDEPRIDFRSNSRLLIITGTVNDRLEGKFYYEWTGSALKLLLKTDVVKEGLTSDES